MLHSILKIDGVSKIKKMEQQKINGGRKQCIQNGVCTDCGQKCAELECVICF